MRKHAAAALIAMALVMACASTKDSYLLKNVDDANKAVALTNQGIAAYNGYLVEQAAYDKIDTVRRFFEVALGFDPFNEKAKQYLDKVSNFRSSLVSEKLQTAEKLLAKPKRQDDESYTLIAALQTAAAVDPSNAAATKLLKDNAKLQATLAESYLAHSKEAQAKAVDPASVSSRETLYVEAYDAAVKASALAPSSDKAKKQKASIKAALQDAFDNHNASVSSLVAKAKFEDAKVELGRASALNSKLGKPYAAAVAASTYALYFQWAKALEAKGSIQEADDKLDLAIAAKRSDEAIALRSRISAKAAAASQGVTFEAALPDIDKLIAKGDLLGANKRIAAAAKLTKDKAKLDLLDARRAKITATLGGLYEKGVADYRSENFKSAIDQLSIVVGIDAEYEQASDYLDKAKEKQKLLDQYSN